MTTIRAPRPKGCRWVSFVASCYFVGLFYLVTAETRLIAVAWFLIAVYASTADWDHRLPYILGVLVSLLTFFIFARNGLPPAAFVISTTVLSWAFLSAASWLLLPEREYYWTYSGDERSRFRFGERKSILWVPNSNPDSRTPEINLLEDLSKDHPVLREVYGLGPYRSPSFNPIWKVLRRRIKTKII